MNITTTYGEAMVKAMIAEAVAKERAEATIKLENRVREAYQDGHSAGVTSEREACAKVAAGYGPSRPIVSKTPSSQIIGRWEGEQAASAGIEAAIRARGSNT